MVRAAHIRDADVCVNPHQSVNVCLFCSLRCQSLLQMAMFRYRRDSALRYSRTLTDHFRVCVFSVSVSFLLTLIQTLASRSVFIFRARHGLHLPPCPGERLRHTPVIHNDDAFPALHRLFSVFDPCRSSSSAAGSSLVIPQPVQQAAASYVNITALFLSAHETWEQADDLTHSGSGKKGQRSQEAELNLSL